MAGFLGCAGIRAGGRRALGLVPGRHDLLGRHRLRDLRRAVLLAHADAARPAGRAARLRQRQLRLRLAVQLRAGHRAVWLGLSAAAVPRASARLRQPADRRDDVRCRRGDVPLGPGRRQLARDLDLRVMLAIGLIAFGGGLWWMASLTTDSAFWELFWPQALRGASMMFIMLPVNQIALGTLPPEAVKNASGLYNLMRNLGGAVGLAMINTIATSRLALHTAASAGAGDLGAAGRDADDAGDDECDDRRQGRSRAPVGTEAAGPDGAGPGADAHLQRRADADGRRVLHRPAADLPARQADNGRCGGSPLIPGEPSSCPSRGCSAELPGYWCEVRSDLWIAAGGLRIGVSFQPSCRILLKPIDRQDPD